MNKLNLISLMLFCPLWLIAQSTDQNYIITTTPTVGVTDPVSLTNANSNSIIQYFDGLGRPIETVQKAQSSTNGTTWVDLVSLTEYDGVGREYRHWLPITSTGNGAFVAPATITANTTTLYGNDGKPYTTTNHESSPLNRVTGQYGAGASWYAGKKNDSILYQTNIADDVAYFYVNSNNNLQKGSNYTANTLYKTVNTDEDGKTVTEYKDKLGQVIMIRSSGDVDTYYVYNDLGELSYVIPPIAADSLPTTGTILDNNGVLKRYAYLYKYDERGNNVVKRLPGCDSICMVYDKADHLVLSQDGSQRLKNKWTVTKYDLLGRVLYTGLLTGNITQNRAYFKAILDNQVIAETYDGTSTFFNTGYTCTGSLTGITPLLVNYYDNYSFTSLATNGSSLNWVTPPTGYDACYMNAKGLLTGTRTYILDKTISSYLTSAVYYDDSGRVVQSRSTNHLGGYDIVYNHYDFTGKVVTSRKEHNTSSQSMLYEVYNNTYDYAGRPLTTTYQYNSPNAFTLTTEKYDELGRLTTKLRHNNTDTLTYAYNIRNWATKITSGGFEENLYYNKDIPSGGFACYNGNIAASSWKYKGILDGYIYKYDDLNRLLWASSILSSLTNDDNHWESFGYDKLGNIKSLARMGNGGDMDNLNLEYNGNQIKSIYDDAGSYGLYNTKEYNDRVNNQTIEFTYDKNGNMISDLDRNIVTIRYNILNLPDTIQFKNGHQIINKYDAGGQKLSTRYYTLATPVVVPIGQTREWEYDLDIIDETGTFYVDNFEYDFNGCDPGVYVLKRIDNSEGYSSYSGTVLSSGFMYNRKDHLGNIREVWNATSNTTVQRTQYYPSGLPWTSNTGDNPDIQNRKYNGKEFIEMHGYDTYDYGARGYYAASGRFTTMDPLAEKYYSISPYAYCAGNPVRYVDVQGKYIDIYYNDKSNKPQVYRFTGKGGETKIPNNKFIKDLINAYNYDVKNGGGDNLRSAAKSTEVVVNISHTNGESRSTDYFNGGQTLNFVEWNTTKGLETTEGFRMSPATILEHEVAHALREETDLKKSDLKQFNSDSEDGSDQQYETKEERRVETGAEAKTAHANGEFPKWYMRKNHGGNFFPTTSVTSNNKDENK